MRNIFTALICGILLISCSKKNIEKENTETSEQLVERISKEENKNIIIDSVGILAYDGFNDLDFVGIQTELTSIMGVKSFLIAAKKGEIKGTQNTYKVDHDLSEFKHLDVLIIPGGNDATYKLTKDSTVLNWIRNIDKTSTYTASICNGSWILGAAGLLKNKKATSHWYRAEEILKRYGAQYVNKRWVHDGKYWTAAGVSSGMDMGLAMVMEAKGKTYAEFVQLSLEYDPKPPVDKGSKEKADPSVVKMMTEMFDMGLGVENIDKSEKSDGIKDKAKKAAASISFANDKDFICGMPALPEYKDTVHYKGKVYGFCSVFCKNKFKENPTEYVKN